jgi:hypothetical protein
MPFVRSCLELAWGHLSSNPVQDPGNPATGNKFELNLINMSRVKNGKIVEEREDYDSLGLMQQLGMELKPIAKKK